MPEGWIIVAAGNPPEYNKSVRDFDVVTLDRIKKIDVEEDYEVWKEYAYQVQIHPAILSYLELRKDHFYRMETTVDGKMFATARGWEDLSEFIKAYERLGRTVDREVGHQYILEGQYSKETLKKLSYASFDERFSVVNMLIGKLNELFREYAQTDQYVTLLYGYLKNYMKGGSIKDTVQEASGEYERLRREEKLDKAGDHLWQQVTAFLETCQLTSARDHLGKEAEQEMVRASFGKETALRENITEKAGNALEHAFDFLEAAFGDSQEMVVFVTELNTGYYSIRYLKENDCDKYYMYNKRLLFDEQQEEVLAQLDEVETELNTALKG